MSEQGPEYSAGEQAQQQPELIRCKCGGAARLWHQNEGDGYSIDCAVCHAGTAGWLPLDVAVSEWNQRQQRPELPGSGPGRTHWAGCWASHGHHACAVARVGELQREVERLRAENDGLRLDLARERYTW